MSSKKKSSRISVNKFEAAVKEELTPTAIVEWCGLQIEIKRYLGYDDMSLFVNAVADNCFGDDASFMPERKHYLIRAIAIELYTNVTLPSNANKQYVACCASGLYELIRSYVNASQFNSIINAIDEKIDYICKTNIDAVQKQIATATRALDELTASIDDAFGDVTKEDLANIISAIGDGGIDEGKLMEAYLQQKNGNSSETAVEG